MNPILPTLRANLAYAVKTLRPATIGGGEFSPSECERLVDEIDTLLAQADTLRTLKRIETRLCRVAIHVGAKDAANIPDTDPRQLNLPI